MANELFGGLGNLGGLMKGLSSLMPQDDPAVKLMNVQSEVSELQNQEKDLYAEIGKSAIAKYGSEGFGDTAERLRLVQSNLAAAQAKLSATKAEQEAKAAAEKEQMAARVCPSCGFENQEGMKFCQECGTKLGIKAKTFCTSCGAELAPGTRFCGECGARQAE